MIPASHHGNWAGPNRLWVEPPAAERSDGVITVAEGQVSYTWSFKGKEHAGRIALTGPAGSLKGVWRDTWHSVSETVLHGRLDQGVVHLFGTYAPGDGSPEWGWRIELDWRDPEAFALRMFNVSPANAEEIAVDLRGTR